MKYKLMIPLSLYIICKEHPEKFKNKVIYNHPHNLKTSQNDVNKIYSREELDMCLKTQPMTQCYMKLSNGMRRQMCDIEE